MAKRPILCVSANPALDRQLRIPALQLGEVNRASRALALPGGKAAHVAMSSRALGARAIWLGFLGGAIGEECGAELRKLDVEVTAIRTQAATRVNLEVIEDCGRITELLEPGTSPAAGEQAEMLDVFAEGLRTKWAGTLVVISGSLPSGVPSSFYESLIRLARSASSEVFVDTSGDGLRVSVEAHPNFVKPNRKELEALLGKPVGEIRSVEDAARQVLQRGPQSIAVTLGSEGLLWIETGKGPVWAARPPRLKPISSVGCGDATLAGFAYASLQQWAGEKAARFAAACGAANCLAEFEGRISAETVQSLLPEIDVERLT